ncbi:HEAT repeat domain-containing protein [Methanosarcina hadiensis]|uniref:HEAT repeat domain-containing protein n=1 Tax=Methanosarcina hadiensis TaxID=3078083 RepID=UPI00397769FF
MSDQPGIHDKTFSQESDERTKAAKQLGALFEAFPDRNQAFEDLLRLCSDRDSEVREEAINSLTIVFPNVQKKELVWERFINLTAYPDELVFKAAVNSLITVFPLIQDKSRAWKDLIELINSKSSLEDVRRGIVLLLPNIISEFPDKRQAWKDLLEMTGSGDLYVRKKAAFFLSMVFPGLPEEKKSEAWGDLLELAGENGDIKVRHQAVKALGEVFPYVPDKDKAYSDLINLAGNRDSYALRDVLKAHSSTHPKLFEDYAANSAIIETEETKEKEEWEEKKSVKPAWYYRTEYDKTKYEKTVFEKADSVQRDATNSPGYGISREEEGKEKRIMGEIGVSGEDRTENEQVKEKESKKSASGFLRQTGDKDRYVRRNAVESFARTYSGFPDKNEIIEDLLRLSSDPDPQMRRGAIESLLSVYLRKADKTQDIWHELLRMSEDPDAGVRRGTAEMLSHVLPAVEEKSTVFYDLIGLAESQDAQLRKKAAELLAVAFKYSDDKQRAWNDLMRLTSSEDREVRKGAVVALSSGHQEVPDKAKVWGDLIRLSAHGDSFVQRIATKTLGPAFFYVPDKTMAWRDLQTLIDNPYIYIRRYALRSLGRASLWRVLKAENEAAYLFGLKEAVKYFKEAAETSVGITIPEFYHPFYEALLQILFGDRSSKLESERYLSDVIRGTGDLEENRKLLETLEEFAGLLQAAGDLSAGDLSARKKFLEDSIGAFDRASGLFEAIEEDYILAQKTFSKDYQKAGKVVTEQRLKETLSGIRYKARTACLKAKGKPTEKITCAVSQKVKGWSFQDIEKDRKKLEKQLESLLNTVTVQIPYIPENTHIFERLEEIRKEQDLLEKYRQVSRFISMIPEVKMFSRSSGR